jgi:tetratricopeptide (TPR) repeat protein
MAIWSPQFKHRRSFGRSLATLLVVGVVLGCGGRSPAQLASEALNAGLQAHTAGNLEEASAQYKKCLEHESNNKFCLYNLGLVAQTQGRPAEAENYYRLSLATDPSYGPAMFNLAVLRRDIGDNVEALSQFRQYVQLFPNDATGHLNLGLLLIATGDLAAGQVEIAEAVRLDPNITVPSAPPAPAPSQLPTGSPAP